MAGVTGRGDRDSSYDRTLILIPIGLAALSFFIYACAALIVSRDQQNDFVPERSSIAAAVSNVAYGAPLGKVYSGVLARFLEMELPLDKTMQQAARRDVPPGALVGSTSDGNGIGYIVVASLGMRLFGLHTSSVVLSMLALMGISALAFVWRFRDRHAVVVIAYFTSLTIMLFTPLTSHRDYVLNVGIGGIRYFSLVAILPAFHLLLELAETRPWGPRLARGEFAAMVVQVAVLVIAILVRNSAAPAIAAVAVGGLLIAWKNRREAGMMTRSLRKLATMVAVGIAFVGLLVLSVSSSYLTDGRFTETVWHRIFLSYGVSREWPFGNVRELYDCKRYIPEGIVRGSEDRNAHCIWWDYATKHNIPVDTAVTKTYGREYDVALREAFFNILRLYPGESLRAFFYYKPRFIAWSIAQSLDIKLTGVQPALIWLLAAALGNLLVFALIPWPPSSSNSMLVAGATVLFASFSILPYLAVWGLPHTTGDLLLYCIFGLALAGTAIIQKVRIFLLPHSAPEYHRIR
jgi:hypothetical protein